MANFNVQGIDELIQAMELEAGRVARNGPDAVMAGGEAAIKAMEATVPVRTGGLQGHIKAKGPMHDVADGYSCDVFPTGTDKRGERYETIGFVNEYGRSNMAPNPWMRTAVESNGDAINEAMADVLMRD